MDPQEKVCERCHRITRVAGDVCPNDGGKLYAVANDEALIGRVIDDKLTLTAVLGKGGMGVVYRARQHSMDREVAVKVLHPSFSGDTESVRRFLHEARAATRLEHPNVITVFDFGRTDDGLLYIVMELLNGRSLADEIERGPIAPLRTVQLIAQVADAVQHAHDRGLVHRDLKPENVILVQGSALRGDHVKVLDFGIARMRSYDGIERITRTGAVCGTPAYMSPEQVLGDEVDARSDVYSLGLITWEMLAGMHPLPADTPMRQMIAHLETPIPSITSVAPMLALPAGLEQAVRRALEKKREARTGSALDLANDLVKAVGSDLTGLGTPVSAAVRSDRGNDTDRSGRDDRRGFADTARATSTPRAEVKSSRRLLPYVAILAVLVLAVVFFATRGDKTEEVASAPVVPVVPVAPVGVGAPEVVAPEVEIVAVETIAEVVPEPEVVAEIVATATIPEVAAPREVAVTSTPSGVNVALDGKNIGVTPLSVALPASGERTVTFKRSGFRPETRTLTATSSDLAVTMRVLRPRSDAPPLVP